MCQKCKKHADHNRQTIAQKAKTNELFRKGELIYDLALGLMSLKPKLLYLK